MRETGGVVDLYVIYTAGCTAVGHLHGLFTPVYEAVIWYCYYYEGLWKPIAVASLESFGQVKDLGVWQFPAAQVTGKHAACLPHQLKALPSQLQVGRQSLELDLRA